MEIKSPEWAEGLQVGLGLKRRDLRSSSRAGAVGDTSLRMPATRSSAIVSVGHVSPRARPHLWLRRKSGFTDCLTELLETVIWERAQLDRFETKWVQARQLVSEKRDGERVVHDGLRSYPAVGSLRMPSGSRKKCKESANDLSLEGNPEDGRSHWGRSWCIRMELNHEPSDP